MLILWIRNYFIWISMTSKVTKVHPILTLTQPFPYWMGRWWFPSKLCGSLNLHLVLLLSLLIYAKINIHTKCEMFFFHVRPLLCRARMIFKNFQIFWLNYNLALHTYGKLLSLIFLNLGSIIYFCTSIKLFCSPDGPIDQPLNSIKRFFNRETNVVSNPASLLCN